MTGLLSPVALFLPGTTHDYAIRQAGPSILSRGGRATMGERPAEILSGDVLRATARSPICHPFRGRRSILRFRRPLSRRLRRTWVSWRGSRNCWTIHWDEVYYQVH